MYFPLARYDFPLPRSRYCKGQWGEVGFTLPTFPHFMSTCANLRPAGWDTGIQHILKLGHWYLMIYTAINIQPILSVWSVPMWVTWPHVTRPGQKLWSKYTLIWILLYRMTRNASLWYFSFRLVWLRRAVGTGRGQVCTCPSGEVQLSSVSTELTPQAEP